MIRERCLLFFKVRGQSRIVIYILVGKYCRQNTEWSVSSRILQLGTIDQHNERKMSVVFQGQRSRSYCHIEEKHCRQDTDPGSYNLVQLVNMMSVRCLSFFKVGGQRSKLYCHIILGKCDRIRCRQDTNSTESSKILHLGTNDHHDKRKIPIVIQGQMSRSYM